MKKIHFIISAAAVVGLATPALADVFVRDGRPLDLPTREVRFGDLNLDSSEGLNRLNTRIAAAVRTVCGQADNRVTREVRDMRSCRVQSMKQAFADRDAIIAARMAARGQAENLAALGSSMGVAAK